MDHRSRVLLEVGNRPVFGDADLSSFAGDLLLSARGANLAAIQNAVGLGIGTAQRFGTQAIFPIVVDLQRQ